MPAEIIRDIREKLNELEKKFEKSVEKKEVMPVEEEIKEVMQVEPPKPVVRETPKLPHYMQPKKHQEEIAFRCVPNKPGLSPQRQMQCTQPKAQRDARACLGKKNKKKHCKWERKTPAGGRRRTRRRKRKRTRKKKKKRRRRTKKKRRRRR